MSKDELIERLAEVAYRNQGWNGDGREFEDASAGIRCVCREILEPYMPAIVAFVAEWIEDYAPYEVEPGWLAHKWREEMR